MLLKNPAIVGPSRRRDAITTRDSSTEARTPPGPGLIRPSRALSKACSIPSPRDRLRPVPRGSGIDQPSSPRTQRKHLAMNESCHAVDQARASSSKELTTSLSARLVPMWRLQNRRACNQLCVMHIRASMPSCDRPSTAGHFAPRTGNLHCVSASEAAISATPEALHGPNSFVSRLCLPCNRSLVDLKIASRSAIGSEARQNSRICRARLHYQYTGTLQLLHGCHTRNIATEGVEHARGEAK